MVAKTGGRWPAARVLDASKSLRALLAENGARADQITVRIGDDRGGKGDSSGGGGTPTTSARRLIITIVADTQEEADEHGMQLQDQGCYCSSTGPTSVECDCSDVK